MQSILFLCTGNYYRSRLAEEYFNHMVSQNDQLIGFQAFSRAIVQDLSTNNNVGFIAYQVPEILQGLGVQARTTQRMPKSVSEAELRESDMVIAMDQIEHYPLMQTTFPAYADKIQYWNVRDMQFEPVYVAVAKLLTRVISFADELAVSNRKDLAAGM